MNAKVTLSLCYLFGWIELDQIWQWNNVHYEEGHKVICFSEIVGFEIHAERDTLIWKPAHAPGLHGSIEEYGNGTVISKTHLMLLFEGKHCKSYQCQALDRGKMFNIPHWHWHVIFAATRITIQYKGSI